MLRKRRDTHEGRKFGRMNREIAYLHDDELEALIQRAEGERCSRSEIIRRALRLYLGIRSGA
jgi:Arc/MetJ-type ribon-helix-helix transcriptional regulator